jgi:hypothetical protein
MGNEGVHEAEANKVKFKRPASRPSSTVSVVLPSFLTEVYDFGAWARKLTWPEMKKVLLMLESIGAAGWRESAGICEYLASPEETLLAEPSTVALALC